MVMRDLRPCPMANVWNRFEFPNVDVSHDIWVLMKYWRSFLANLSTGAKETRLGTLILINIDFEYAFAFVNFDQWVFIYPIS